MKVILKKRIDVLLAEAITGAALRNEKIDRIELTESEMGDFKAYLRKQHTAYAPPWLVNNVADSGYCSFMGVSIVAAPK